MSSSGESPRDEFKRSDFEPDDKEYKTVAALAISVIALVLAFVGLLMLPDLGRLRIVGGLSVSILVVDVVVYVVALGTSMLTYYYSNFGSWEKRYSGLKVAKHASLCSAVLVSLFSIWRLLTVFIHCQRATDEQHASNDAACWENFDTIVSSIAFQFIGVFVLILCQFAMAYHAHRRRLDIHDAFAGVYAREHGLEPVGPN
ncbi:uncharacterized protein AMSG_01815 [Thecamonas trahens ATCC 50062]|uniref:MARVEL domain-containing protein n=1 Tax=Thecamonas trahens ATCC 50062 TaxID=461836 RepID=A0A0L0DTK1_THETB|nr:hypothetical protein AMSG_01815 [Thecamonas trahens ATCC 50062]KNC55552.1 hypothetical protein AMSG_01815 [Thecamonas trahens ATCC 50062]|eukprot:XP_013761326.1 hypothetical protein AMSG_01815 [Thecamonas trahens ATCC 50062]